MTARLTVERPRWWVTPARCVVAMIAFGSAFLALWVPPAYACSCAVNTGALAHSVAASDGAFVGVYVGRDDPQAEGEVISSARLVINHFQVERAVRGDIGERVDVVSAAEGASCGLELSEGQRTGLLLRREGEQWTSGLCSRVDPDALLGVSGVGVDDDLPRTGGWGIEPLGTVLVAVLLVAVGVWSVVATRGRGTVAEGQ